MVMASRPEPCLDRHPHLTLGIDIRLRELGIRHSIGRIAFRDLQQIFYLCDTHKLALASIDLNYRLSSTKNRPSSHRRHPAASGDTWFHFAILAVGGLRCVTAVPALCVGTSQEWPRSKSRLTETYDVPSYECIWRWRGCLPAFYGML